MTSNFFRNLITSSQRFAVALSIPALISLTSPSAAAYDFEPLNAGRALLQSFSDFEGFDAFLKPAAESIESDLIKVTSDAMNGGLTLRAVVAADQSLEKLKYVTTGSAVLDMPLEDLAKGVILMQSGKYQVLKLIGPHLDRNTGGDLDLIYLSDGIWNSYKTFPMMLVHSGDTWTMTTRDGNRNGTPFNAMYLKKKTFFGKVIGLESVSVSNDPI